MKKLFTICALSALATIAQGAARPEVEQPRSVAQRLAEMQAYGANEVVRRLGIEARANRHPDWSASESMKKIIADDLRSEVFPKIQGKISADKEAQLIQNILQAKSDIDFGNALVSALSTAFAAGY